MAEKMMTDQDFHQAMQDACQFHRNAATETTDTITAMLTDLSKTLRHAAGRFDMLTEGYWQHHPVSNAAEELATLMLKLTDTQYKLIVHCHKARERTARAEVYENVIRYTLR